MYRRDGSWVVQEQGDGWNDFSSLKEAVKEKRDGGREGEEAEGLEPTPRRSSLESWLVKGLARTRPLRGGSPALRAKFR